ncbi:MAG: DUF1697 domain-containing protein [Cyclobacteriaceae bacterium]|nr:DUF1697 domain-containing protein [Cyclobacteriaceae bacterium SS2]
MAKYIAMLRGINVSGQKLIKMADLRESMTRLGLENVATYVQSGNILFNTQETDLRVISERISSQIKKDFTFDVPCIVRSAEYFKKVLTNNDFLQQGRDEKRCYVTFLEEEPDPMHVQKIDSQQYAPEEFIIKGDLLYFYSPDGYGKAKMNNNFFEQKLRVKATTRNWNSVNKLYELATQ